MSETQRWWKCEALMCKYNRRPVECDEAAKLPDGGHDWIECDANGDPLTAAPMLCHKGDFQHEITRVTAAHIGPADRIRPVEESAGAATKHAEDCSCMNCRMDYEDLPPQPTGSAYSVEEHMFQQDEIQKRHPQPPDQQRSDAVTVEAEAILQAMNADTLRELVKQHAQTIAELTSAIASLQRWGDSLLDENGKIKTLVKEKKEQIAALQARLKEQGERIDNFTARE